MGYYQSTPIQAGPFEAWVGRDGREPAPVSPGQAAVASGPLVAGVGRDGREPAPVSPGLAATASGPFSLPSLARNEGLSGALRMTHTP